MILPSAKSDHEQAPEAAPLKSAAVPGPPLLRRLTASGAAAPLDTTAS
jgi:hypothetical protein